MNNNQGKEIACGFSLATNSFDMQEVASLARDDAGTEAISKRTTLDASRALNAGLSPDDVKHALEFITVIFKTGAAGLSFLKALRDFCGQKKCEVIVSEPVSGKLLGRINEETKDEEIKKMSGQ